MSGLRCGVAGLGRGRKFVRILDAIDGCRVTAVCDTNPAALSDFAGLAAHTDYDAFLAESLDVVAVISPGPVHADQAVRAMQAGAHVLCETPCVYSLAEARAVVRAARRTGGKFMLAEDYVWMGWVEQFRAKAAAGLFGQIVYAEGDYTHDCRDIMLADAGGLVPYAQRDRRPDARPTWRATHLPPITYCSHTLGPLLHLMDDRIVSAVGFSAGSRAAPDLGTIDLEAGLFRTAAGAVVRLTNGFTVACPFSLFYNLVGTIGSASVARAGAFSARWYSDRADPPAPGWTDLSDAPGFADRADGRDRVAVMTEEFIDAVRNDADPPIDVYRSMDFVLPGVLAHQSALAGGVAVDVPDLRDDPAD